MIIKYKFINGEKVEIEVSNDLGNTMLQIENETRKSNRRETMRHKSISEIWDKSDMLIDQNINVEEDILKRLDLDKQAMSQKKCDEYLNIKESSMWQKVWRIKQKLKDILGI